MSLSTARWLGGMFRALIAVLALCAACTAKQPGTPPSPKPAREAPPARSASPAPGADRIPVGVYLRLKGASCVKDGNLVLVYATPGACRAEAGGSMGPAPFSVCLKPGNHTIRTTCKRASPPPRRLEVRVGKNTVLFARTGRVLRDVPATTFVRPKSPDRGAVGADAVLARARKLRARGEVWGAIGLLEQILDSSRPIEPDALAAIWCELSLSYLFGNDPGSARNAWDEGRKLRPAESVCVALVLGQPRKRPRRAVKVKPTRCARRGPDPALMMRVPAGPFLMGAKDVERKAGTFCIDRTEVTVGRYKACVRAGKCGKPGTKGYHCTWDRPDADQLPVNCVNWDAARAYCAWARKRLPTEVEWEKAARGTDGRHFPWGDALATCDHAVVAGDGPTCSRLQPVGRRPMSASPYGVLDLVGNVDEWTLDRYKGSTSLRVARGGTWNSWPVWPVARLRSGMAEVGAGNGGIGFRCVR